MQNAILNMPQQAPQQPPQGQPPAVQSIANVGWRVQVTRDQRQSLITKIYQELIRVTGEAPGATVWMKASVYELKLFNESQERQEYVNKIARRLQLLKHRPTHVGSQNMSMNPGMPQTMNPNMMQSQMGGMPGNNMPQYQPQVSRQQPYVQNRGMPPQGPAGSIPSHVKEANAHQAHQRSNMRGDMNNALPHKVPGGSVDPQVYWSKHAELKSAYWENVMVVYKAFRKYVDHLKDQSDNEQRKKLQYLLGYVDHVVNILQEDPGIHQPKDLSELDKVEKYIKKIVIPYLSKLNAEKNKRNGAPGPPTGGTGTTANTGSIDPSSQLGMSSSLSVDGQMNSNLMGNPMPQGQMNSTGMMTTTSMGMMSSGMYINTPMMGSSSYMQAPMGVSTNMSMPMTTPASGMMNFPGSYGMTTPSMPGTSMPMQTPQQGQQQNFFNMNSSFSFDNNPMDMPSDFSTLGGSLSMPSGSIPMTNATGISTSVASNSMAPNQVGSNSNSNNGANDASSNNPAQQQLMSLVETL